MAKLRLHESIGLVNNNVSEMHMARVAHTLFL